MRRTPLVVTILVSAVVGTVLAVLAPAASASDSGSSPGNRGWVAPHGAADESDSDD